MADSKRIGLTLNAELRERFEALAEYDGIKPTTLATEIVLAYMRRRAADIDAILPEIRERKKKITQIRADREDPITPQEFFDELYGEGGEYFAQNP